jgi:branched-chain amino acid transport system ATP-binding protein
MQLEVHELHVRYGRVHAVRGVSITLAAGEIVAVLGANGAGKSSLLRAIMGLTPPAGGAVRLGGEDITRWSTSARVRRGLVLVPEGRRIIMSLTIHENLLMGAFNRRDQGAVAAELADVYAAFPKLASRRHHPASVLSGGEQQMLAIGRGLLARPQVMMLDEPSLGLGPLLANEVFALIARLNRERGQTILLVEQNTHRALALARRAYVLELGLVALEGPPAQILADRALQDAYLGRGTRNSRAIPAALPRGLAGEATSVSFPPPLAGKG